MRSRRTLPSAVRPRTSRSERDRPFAPRPTCPTLRAATLVVGLVSLSSCASGGAGTPARPLETDAFLGTWSGVVMIETETAFDVATRGDERTKEYDLTRRFLVLRFEEDGQALKGELTVVPDRLSLRESHWMSATLEQEAADGRSASFVFYPDTMECEMDSEVARDHATIEGVFRCRVKDVAPWVLSQSVRTQFELEWGEPGGG